MHHANHNVFLAPCMPNNLGILITLLSSTANHSTALVCMGKSMQGVTEGVLSVAVLGEGSAPGLRLPPWPPPLLGSPA